MKSRDGHGGMRMNEMLPALGLPQAGPGGRPRTGLLQYDALDADEKGLSRVTRVSVVIK